MGGGTVNTTTVGSAGMPRNVTSPMSSKDTAASPAASGVEPPPAEQIQDPLLNPQPLSWGELREDVVKLQGCWHKAGDRLPAADRAAREPRGMEIQALVNALASAPGIELQSLKNRPLDGQADAHAKGIDLLQRAVRLAGESLSSVQDPTAMMAAMRIVAAAAPILGQRIDMEDRVPEASAAPPTAVREGTDGSARAAPKRVAAENISDSAATSSQQKPTLKTSVHQLHDTWQSAIQDLPAADQAKYQDFDGRFQELEDGLARTPITKPFTEHDRGNSARQTEKALVGKAFALATDVAAVAAESPEIKERTGLLRQALKTADAALRTLGMTALSAVVIAGGLALGGVGGFFYGFAQGAEFAKDSGSAGFMFVSGLVGGVIFAVGGALGGGLYWSVKNMLAPAAENFATPAFEQLSKDRELRAAVEQLETEGRSDEDSLTREDAMKRLQVAQLLLQEVIAIGAREHKVQTVVMEPTATAPAGNTSLEPLPQGI